MFYNIFIPSENEKCLYVLGSEYIYVYGCGCMCVRVSNVCMQIAIRQTDSGNQATDSLLNLLKPQIVLSLF